MTTNDHASEYLDFYLALESAPDLAVLLEGPWGSGKSYFVEHYFKRRLAEMKSKDEKAKDDLIHVTLFGVRDVSDITTQIFEKAHPLLGGKAAKLINVVGARLGSVLGAPLDAKENTKPTAGDGT